MGKGLGAISGVPLHWLLVGAGLLGIVAYGGISGLIQPGDHQASGGGATAESQPLLHSSVPRVNYPAGQEPEISLPKGGTLAIRSMLDVDRSMKYGEFVWNEEGVPPGPMFVRVDLSRQVISVMRGGYEIGTAVIVYGAEQKGSPIGQFSVLRKQSDYRSRTYQTGMPYTLMLTNDGVAIHASSVREGAATHGCIGVPIVFAQKLFMEMKLGDQVVIVA